MTRESQPAGEEEDEHEECEECAEYCGFYDDANKWHDVVDGVSGVYDRNGTFTQDPPWVLDAYWSEIENERTHRHYS